MKIWDFICYCFSCLTGLITSAFGHTPQNHTWKESLVGAITLIIIIALFIIICWLISLAFKRK